MRGHLDPGWSHLKAGLVGALVAAVGLLSFPVVAAVGDTLLLGRQNSADAVTQLSGSATVNLRLTNNQPAAPALEFARGRGGAAAEGQLDGCASPI